LDVTLGSTIVGLFALGLGFLALALARRLGFVVLWLLLLTYWAWTVLVFDPPHVQQPFLAWTAWALPLALLTTVGFPDSSRSRWRKATVGLFMVWLAGVGVSLWLRMMAWDVHLPPLVGFERVYVVGIILPLPIAVGLNHLRQVVGTIRRPQETPTSAA
jgi:hypothetical protein